MPLYVENGKLVSYPSKYPISDILEDISAAIKHREINKEIFNAYNMDEQELVSTLNNLNEIIKSHGPIFNHLALLG